MLMKRSSYGERDYAFGQAMLTLRTTIGLTQAGLAEHLGVSRRAVVEWEAGSSYPKADHLKEAIVLGVQQQAFPAGREAEEIRAFWQAARQKLLLDESWLATLLSQQLPHLTLLAPLPVEQSSGIDHVLAPPSVGGPRVDWGDALAVPTFYGRERELAALAQWVVEERCRVVSVLGMGGIGKSALVVSAMHQLATHFQVVLFRSLRDAPSCEALLDECLQVLAPQPLDLSLASLELRISRLLEHLRSSRVLLVLDNLESLLEEGDVRGRLRPGYEGYGRLLRRVAETGHQSCLLLTSREKPAELRALEGSRSPVHALRLPGLEAAACEQLLAEHEVVGSPDEQARLVEGYAGNPLALQIVAETIADLFGGEIGPFLAQDTAVFGTIAELLDEQVARLSALEQTVLSWLAIVREPVTLEELRAMLVAPLPSVQVLEAVDGLRRRSLVERGQRPGSVTLQSVVLEYVTAELVAQAASEIEQGRLSRLIEHGLCQAQAKEYVRQTQARLLLAPLLARLQSASQGQADVEELLLSLLDQVRTWAEEAQGYGPANLVALLRVLRGDLRGLDLSRLALRGVHLQGVEMQDASLVEATLRDIVFTKTFNAIWSVAISPRGTFWAAGSSRGEVHVWRKEGYALHLAWQAHTDTVERALAFSPDERLLASGSWDGTIKLWDVEYGTLLWTGWHADIVESLAFAPNGQMIASCGDDATIRLWDARSGVNVQTITVQGGAVDCVAWSPDGTQLASGGFDGRIRVWELHGTQSATCVQTLSEHTHFVVGLAWSPDGAHLASGSCDRTVKVWDVASGYVCQTLSGHTDHVYATAWSPDGRTVASAGLDGTIWLWDVKRGSYRTALHGHTGHVYSIAFTPDSRSLLSGSEDRTLRVWDVESGQCVHIIQGYAVSLYDVAWSPDGTQLVSGGTDTLVTLWDVADRTPPRVLRGHSRVVQGVVWSPDGRLLASSGRDNAIRLWDPATGTCVQILQDPDYSDTLFWGVAWSPDGKLLASGSYIHGVQVWDMTTRSRRWVGRAHPTWARRVAWSPDSCRLASCGDDGTVRLWLATDGTVLQTLHGHCANVAAVTWSPDGTWLASGGVGRSKGELFLWEADSGKLMRVFEGLPDGVYAVAWNTRGDLLVSGESNGILRWWEAQSGKCLAMREGHQGAVHSLKISPDGRLLVSCGEDGTIKVWNVESTDLVRTLRRDRPYERLDITGIRGVTEAQKATLRALGAIENLS
jgi:WD40 repeat protein/transcriptional regulator with XRE-family HTH domain